MIDKINREFEVLDSETKRMNRIVETFVIGSPLFNTYLSTIKSTSFCANNITSSFLEALSPSQLGLLFKTYNKIVEELLQRIGEFNNLNKELKKSYENSMSRSPSQNCSTCLQNIEEDKIKMVKLSLEQNMRHQFLLAAEQFNRIANEPIFSQEQEDQMAQRLHYLLSQKQKVLNVNVNRMQEYVGVVDSSLADLRKIQQIELNPDQNRSHNLQFYNAAKINEDVAGYLQKCFEKRIPNFISKMYEKMINYYIDECKAKQRQSGMQTQPDNSQTIEIRQLNREKRLIQKQLKDLQDEIVIVKAAQKKLEDINKSHIEQIESLNRAAKMRAFVKDQQSKQSRLNSSAVIETAQKIRIAHDEEESSGDDDVDYNILEGDGSGKERRKRNRKGKGMLPLIKRGDLKPQTKKKTQGAPLSNQQDHKSPKSTVFNTTTAIKQEQDQNKQIVKQQVRQKTIVKEKKQKMTVRNNSKMTKVSENNVDEHSKKKERDQPMKPKQATIESTEVKKQTAKTRNSINSQNNRLSISLLNNQSMVIVNEEQKTKEAEAKSFLRKVSQNISSKIFTKHEVLSLMSAEKRPQMVGKPVKNQPILNISASNFNKRGQLTQSKGSQKKINKQNVQISTKAPPKNNEQNEKQPRNTKERPTPSEHSTSKPQKPSVGPHRIYNISSLHQKKLSSVYSERAELAPKTPTKHNSIFTSPEAQAKMYQYLRNNNSLPKSINYNLFSSLVEKVQTDLDKQTAQKCLPQAEPQQALSPRYKVTELAHNSVYGRLFINRSVAYRYQEYMAKSYHKKILPELSQAQSEYCYELYCNLLQIKKLGQEAYSEFCSILRYPFQTLYNHYEVVNFISEMSYDTFEFFFRKIVWIHRRCSKEGTVCEHVECIAREIKHQLNHTA